MKEQYKNFEKTQKYLSEDDIVQGPKKFVFQIQPENVKYIETLSYQEKQELINNLILRHRQELIEEIKQKQFFSWIKKSIIAIVAVLVGLPLLFYFLSFSLDLTKANYQEMQRNFEKLF